MATNKVIVTNEGALRAKYGTDYALVQGALKTLIAADAKRGITSIVVPLDDAQTMAALNGAPVTKAKDPNQNKASIDAVFNHYNPDYLMILGAVDVIPHQDLLNPVYSPADPVGGDPDQYAYSDLPYACPGGYSQTVSQFLDPTRVVGRLPDVTGGKDAKYLAGLLKSAAGYSSRPASIYKKFFGVTAAIWARSTELSLIAAFGSATGLNKVPPRSYRWTPQQLRQPSHFFNCHGAAASPQFFGQPASGAEQYPVAHDAAYLRGKTAEGTVIAAECCYGAELFDPALAGGQQGISNQYLENGAYGFWGSTTIAYGPSDANANADLICQYLFAEMLSDASLGRAALQARQKYIAQMANLSPTDLKTLAQFYLLGDPSVHPVVPPPPGAAPHLMKTGATFTKTNEKTLVALARAERRSLLTQNGMALAGSVSVSEPSSGQQPPESVRKLIAREARKIGVTEPHMMTFAVRPPTALAAARTITAKMPGAKVPRAIHIGIGRITRKVTSEKVIRLAGVEIVEYDGDAKVRQFVSR